MRRMQGTPTALGFRALLSSGVLVLLAGAAWAADTPGDEALGERYRPAQRIFAGNAVNPSKQRLLRQTSVALRSLETALDCETWSLWNEDTLGVRTVLLSGPRLRSGTMAPEELEALARVVVDEHSQLLGVNASDLSHFRTHPIRQLRVVTFLQLHDGLPVRPSFVNVVFTQREDELLLTRLDAEVFPRLDIPTFPSLLPLDASRIARDWCGGPPRVVGVAEPELEVAPAARPDGKGVEPRLVFRCSVTAQDPVAVYEVLIDAYDGTIVSAYDTVNYLDIVGNVSGFASPGLLPDNASNPPTLRALEGLRVTVPGVGSAVTDATGNFTIPNPGTSPLDVTFQLLGPYVNVNNAAGADLTVTTTVTPGVPVDVIFNDPPTAAGTAQVNGMIQTHTVHEFLKSLDPTWNELDLAMPCNTNVAGACNAFFNGSSINFYPAGSGCVNSCYSSVVYHEYGHAVVFQIFPFNPAGNFNEGISDVLATTLADDPRVGANFQGGGSLRNVNTQNRSFPQDVGNPIHDAGLIVGGSFWDTLLALDATVGHAQALDLVRDYYFFHMFFLTGQIIPLLVADVLTVDDNDGNVLNGTPHYAEIAQGFGLHGLDAPDLNFFAFTHSPQTDTVNDQFPYEIRVEVEGLISPVASVLLRHRVNGAGPYLVTPMNPTGVVSEYLATIPPVPSPGRVEYYFEATNTDGEVVLFPVDAPGSPLSYFVGTVTEIYLDTIGGNDAGWTHVQVTQQDDWQRGAPSPTGSTWDPTSAFSLPFCWGNDLGGAGFNGNYQNNVSNYIESPVIDCSAHTNVWLQYRRWLTVESGQFDNARVLVNGTVYFANPTTVDLIDTEWTALTHSIAAVADGNPAVQVRFTLQSDAGLNFGGWNFDDVRLVSVTASNPTIFAYALPTVAIPAGTSAIVPASARFDAGVSSYGIAVQHDPALVQVIDATLVGTPVALASPDFVSIQTDNTSGYCTALVIVDVSLSSVLPPAADQEILRIEYAASAVGAGATAALTFVDGLGSPSTDNFLTLADASVVTPFRTNGTIEITPATGLSFVRGDGNGDGAVNAPDAVFALQFLFAGGVAPLCWDALDFDDNGAVNLPDPVSLLNFLFLSGPTPPAPFPAAGPDPTVDTLPCP
ncbi:MAG: hypothetical protein AB7O52_10375 [Planctomycetota bacterium]